MSIFFKPQTCDACGKGVKFSIMFCYEIDSNLDAKKRKRFCIAHGLEEMARLLNDYIGKVLVAEPGIDQMSGLFFYAPDDLAVHEYSQEDKEKLEGLLSDMEVNACGPVLKWLDQDVIGDCHEEPLFKGDFQNMKALDISELIRRLEHVLKGAEAKVGKGEFWITEPRGQAGIYIWDDVV